MPLRDSLSALLVVVIWGVNFVVIKIGLKDSPPLLLGALRFALVAFPAILFVRRPRIPTGKLLAYALSLCFGQFAFLFSAIHLGMPTGLASLVLQLQAFFTLALTAIVFGDRLGRHNLAGLALAFAGLGVLAFASVGGASVGGTSVGGANLRGAGVPLIGFVLTICAAASWAIGNIVSKTIGPADLLGLVVWSAPVPVLPFLAASALLEGPERIAATAQHISLALVLAVAYLAFAATLTGYTLWGRLLTRHPAWKVAPLSLMVPVVGLTTSWLALGESLSPAQGAGALVVLAGLVLNVFGGRLFRRPQPAE
ncbi:MAG: EamA family transporter [Telmatospirillum sp.]|nr:EamA family transporter [Telmatospirillum sp.]